LQERKGSPLKKNDIKSASLVPIYSDKLKEQLKLKVTQYGDFSFEQDNWYCSKMHKNAQQINIYTLRFKRVNKKYRDLIKFYALMLTNSLPTIQTKIYNIAYFFEYLEQFFPKVELKNIDRTVIDSFQEYLRLDKKKVSPDMKRKTYKDIHQLFKIMCEFPEFPAEIPTRKINPFRKRKFEANSSDKYIPEEYVKQWDFIMKDEENGISLETRAIYWMIRSFPNRISEVLSMKHNCLKPLYSNYTLQIPSYKQNGGYLIEEIKTIGIPNTPHGKFLISLIKKLQEQRKKRLNELPIMDKDKIYKDYLFLTIPSAIIKQSNKVSTVPAKCHKPRIIMYSYQKISDDLENLSKLFNIVDSKGNYYSPTTHQFRHNAITDRMYNGFTFEQISKHTAHKSKRMLKEYTHQLKEHHKEVLMEMSGLSNPKDAPVSFKGKIKNLDEKTVKFIEKLNPNAYLTWEANGKKGVGICSNIVDCNPKGTSVHFECYSCEWFVPKAEYLEDYQKELEYWMQIIKQNEDKPNRAAHLENAIRNANLLERIIKICEIGVEQYKKELEEKMRKKQKRDINATA
jgi:hypothetical protein